jgi:glycosyltransferase involved in cell wall biosynthesis
VRLALLGDWEPDEPGGPGAVALFLARELVAAGHEVHVVTAADVDAVEHERYAEGVRVTRVPGARGPVARRAARRALRGLEVDGALLLSVFVPLHVTAARLLGVPYVVMPLGGYAAASVAARRPRLKRLWLALAERRYLEQAAAVDVWSRNEQADVERLCRPRRIVVTPPGLPHGVTPGADRTARESRRLLYLGRFAVPQKGLDDLVDAFGRVARDGDRLTLAGVDHRGGEQQLRSRVAAAGLGERVVLRGPAYGTDKAALFADHDAFVHLSRWEGLPLAVVEAMAAELPVVVTGETNVADLVEQYGAGWVADGDAGTALRAALDATPQERRERGRAARRLVEQEMSWRRVAGAVVAALQQA